MQLSCGNPSRKRHLSSKESRFAVNNRLLITSKHWFRNRTTRRVLHSLIFFTVAFCSKWNHVSRSRVAVNGIGESRSTIFSTIKFMGSLVQWGNYVELVDFIILSIHVCWLAFLISMEAFFFLCDGRIENIRAHDTRVFFSSWVNSRAQYQTQWWMVFNTAFPVW